MWWSITPANNFHRTRSKLYPHMGGQKGRFSSYFQKGGKVSQNVLGCFGGAYLKYFYKWSHICLKSLKCINKSTRLSFLKKVYWTWQKKHRPSKNPWKLTGLFFPVRYVFHNYGKNSPVNFHGFFEGRWFFC